VGTVSGLALMTGATALVAVSGGHHSIFAVLLMGLLATVMAHALVVEIQRQARRRSQIRWHRTDTVNTVLLACWALTAVATSAAPFAPRPVRALGLLLTVGYAAAAVYFVVERRRAVAVAPLLPAPPSAAPSAFLPAAPSAAPSAFLPAVAPESVVESRDPLADSTPSA
jgi:hypothetical protein